MHELTQEVSTSDLRRIRPITLLYLVLVIFGQTTPQAAAQEELDAFGDRRVMTAPPLALGENIELDGLLDEAAWERAAPATGFIQRDPDNGAAATEPTEVFILYSENSMYMGIIAHDSEPDQLRGNTMERDAFLNADDSFQWVFDTYLDERTGYFFGMNPSGAMGDPLVSQGGGRFGGGDREWDGIWDAQVRRSEIGWVIEIEMPFR